MEHSRKQGEFVPAELGAIKVTFRGDATTVVELCGEFDDCNQDAFAEAFTALDRVSRLVFIDDTQLTFIGVQPAARLGKAVKRLNESGVEVRLRLRFAPLFAMLKLFSPEVFELTPAYSDCEATVGNHASSSPSVPAMVEAIHADIRTAIEEGLLPARWTYSVHADTSLSRPAINVTIEDCPDAWLPSPDRPCWNASACGDGFHQLGCPAQPRLSPDAEVACMTLHRIHDGFNDIGPSEKPGSSRLYYGTVSVKAEKEGRMYQPRTRELDSA
jgi:anti-anti-sigma regulatory factor